MKKSICSFSIVLLSVFFSLQSIAQTAADTVRIIDDIIESWKNDGPGGALLISKGNKDIYKKAFGYANIEFDVKNTTETVFEAGSVSKQFTATAVLLLVQDRKISLDDDIRKYIPALPDYHQKITVKNLITHTSGVKDWRNIVGLSVWPTGAKVWEQASIMDVICKQTTLNFNPGTEYSYSNSNYTLLVALIEQVTGKSFAKFTTEKIFVPVGMSNTQWRDNFRTIVKHRASGYAKIKNGYLLDMPFENGHGPGGLLTTIDDLCKWNRYWAAGHFGKMLDTLRNTQYVLSDGKKIPYTTGAVNIKYLNGHKIISHSGATAGYRTFLTYYPDLDISVSFLSNSAATNTSQISNSLDRLFTSNENLSSLFLPKTNGISINGQLYAKYQGMYKRPGRFEIKNIVLKNNDLLCDNIKINALKEDTLLVGNDKIWFNDDQSFTLFTSTGTYLYKKELPFQPSDNEKVQYVGEFNSTEADANIKVELKGGILRLIKENGASIMMTPIYPNGFRAGAMVVHFDKNINGKFNTVSVSLSRAENILFSRK